ncbi:hypothetical protein ROB41_004511 [Escherichia coli]|nr:hypothetical protein [Escherichia coli]
MCNLFSTMNREKRRTLLEPYFYFTQTIIPDKDASHFTLDDVVDHVYNDLLYNSKNRPLKKLDNTIELVNSESSCVVANVFGIIFQLLGIRQSIIRSATRSLLEELGEDVLRGLKAKVHDIAHASTMPEKAKEIWGLSVRSKMLLVFLVS